MAVRSQSVYIGSDHTIRLTGLNGGGGYLNGATVTWELKTIGGVTVTGGTGTLTYVPASDGNYVGTLDRTVTILLLENSWYNLFVVMAQGGYDDERRLTLSAAYRQGS